MDVTRDIMDAQGLLKQRILDLKQMELQLEFLKIQELVLIFKEKILKVLFTQSKKI